MGICFYIGVNFAELAKLINAGEKLTKNEKAGMSFLKSKKCLLGFLLVSFAFVVLSFIVFNPFALKIFFSLVSVILISCFIMDMKMKLLPDFYTLSLLWIALMAAALGITDIDPSMAIIASASFYLFFFIVDNFVDSLANKIFMGGGDIKILAAFGALFGFTESVVILFFSCMFMLVYVLITNISGKSEKEIPLGVGLSTIAMVNIFYPSMIDTVVNYLTI